MSLRLSATRAIAWGAGFTLVREVLQFGAMLVLVRLLLPEDYGRMALAQTLLGLVAAASYKSVALHVLQFRDPRNIDWQSHFTAGFLINSVAMLVVLAIAAFLAEFETYAVVAAPLAALSILLLIEVPSTLRYTMIQTAHDWARFRVLALRVPVVTSLCTTEARRMVEQGAALGFEPRNAERLRGHLVSLAGDPALGKRITPAAETYLEPFHADQANQGYETLFRQVVAARTLAS